MDSFFLICLRSCLKGDRDREYYDLLNITDKNPSIDDIKKAYKKASLNFHPDKLAQKGIEVTEEHTKRFNKMKEAYDVLSDPKRRKIYDQLGSNGLKLFENPQSIEPIEIIKNFQKNRSDRLIIFLFLLIIFAAFLILPILFSMKCDKSLGKNAPWLAIWTPMWIFDLFLLLTAFAFCAHNNNSDSTDEEQVKDEVSFSIKFDNFVRTILFILIQIFIMMKLDHEVTWTWWFVFIPWYLYEISTMINLFISSFITFHQPPPNNSITTNNNSNDIESQQHRDDELLQLLLLKNEYFEKLITQSKDRKDFVISILRLWLSLFLALQFESDNYSYNWGFIFLPIWLYLLSYIVMYKYYSNWIDFIINSTTSENSEQEISMKNNHVQVLSSMSASYLTTLFTPLFMAILLIVRLTTFNFFSTAIIILPIFLFLGCCCSIVSCFLCLASCAPMDDIEKAQTEYDNQSPTVSDSNNSSNNMNNHNASKYEPPQVVIIPKNSVEEINSHPNSSERSSTVKNEDVISNENVEVGFADIDD